MGYLDDRLDQLQQGADDLAAGDEIRRTNQLLTLLLLEQTGERDVHYFEDGFESTPPGESEDQNRTPEYASLEGVTVTGELSTLSWDFEAESVAIRSTGDNPVRVAFKDPADHDDAFITLSSGDIPFVFSGLFGLRARGMWFQRPSNVADYNMDVLTVKRRGGPP